MKRVYISKDGQRQGPFTVEELNRLLGAEAISGNDLYQDEAGGDWLPLSQFPGFEPPESEKAKETATEAPKNAGLWIGIAVVVLVLLVGGIFLSKKSSPGPTANVEESATPTPAPATPLPPPPQATPEVAQSTPAAGGTKKLAPGTFYLLRDVSMATDDGVIGMQAGSIVRSVGESGDIISVSDGQHVFKVRKKDLSDDSAIGAQVIANRVQTPKPAPTPPPVAWQDLSVIYNLKSTATDAQKDAAWKRFKGKRINWVGTVVSITRLPGTFEVKIKMDPDSIGADLLVNMKSSPRTNNVNLQPGVRVQFTGILDQWSTVNPITVQEGEILSAL